MVSFKCNPEAYKDHYCVIEGGNRGDVAHLLYFKGTYMQRGYGNVFGKLTRSAIPLFNGVGRNGCSQTTWKKCINDGSKILQDMSTGERSLKGSVRKHGEDVLRKRFKSFLGGRVRKLQGREKKRSVDILDNKEK